jgi:precorrin-2 dehydrogenase/sirohydrochlorin ferrochelatase
MLPIILDVSSLKVAVIGNGLQAVKRLDMLRDADVSEIDIFSPDPGDEMKAAAGNVVKLHLPSAEDISSYAIIFIANLEAEEVEKLD